MICFHFSSESLNKIKIKNLNLLDDSTLLKEVVNDILTSILKVLLKLILLEKLEIWIKGIDIARMLISEDLVTCTLFFVMLITFWYSFISVCFLKKLFIIF